ncbi:MAG: glycosyltransferase, partial [Synergistaceae bacterium]|nr:glycosyltransferase [Synergistaceae bacterium]
GKLKDENWVLNVLGDGPERKKLEGQATALGIEDKIIFHGYSEEADKFMARSSCLLFPSLSEGYGLVLARALQIGLPVIASNIEQVKKILGSTENMPYPCDVDSWAEEIKKEIFGLRSYDEKKIKVFGMNEMADGILKLYRSALCGRFSNDGE